MSAERIAAVPPIGAKRVGLPAVTLDEYRALELASETRLEYVDGVVVPKDGVYVAENGEIRAMSGESPPHNRIALNISILLDRAFEGRQCEVYFENIKTRVSSTRYRYPDVVALCGQAQFDQDTPPALLNPNVIVEVLSPSTEDTDRGAKSYEYRDIPTVTDYVLVAQDRVAITHYARRIATEWFIAEYTALSDALTLTSLAVSLNAADIYRKVALPASAPPA